MICRRGRPGRSSQRGVAEMQNLFCARLDSVVQHPLLHGHRRHQLSAGRADGVRQRAGDGRQLADHKSTSRRYCILFLLLETGMLGVFCALDFFLFYVFWEVMLLPMYFLIGVWGGPRREYAAIKFFLYTLLGSVLMLIAILMLYFTSDLTQADRRAARCHRRRQLDSSMRQPSRPASRRFSARTSAAHVQHPGPAADWASTPINSTTKLLWRQVARNGGPSCCCSSASRSRCPACRCTPGCPTRTSRRRRRSR